MRPVYVQDVASALASFARDDATVGKDVELYGPSSYTYKGLVELFQDASMRQQHTIPIPKAVLK